MLKVMKASLKSVLEFIEARKQIDQEIEIEEFLRANIP